MPTIRSTKPDLDEQLPVALAARIARTDRASLAHLVDHGLIPRLDLDSVRALASSGEVTAKATDEPRHLVTRLDLDPMTLRIADMSDSQLEQALEGPHRVPAAYLGREVLVAVRSFIIATGRIDALGEPVALRTDRRGREIYARTIIISLETRLTDLTDRPPKAAGDHRWLGRRARVGTGGAILTLEA
ncbi:hypothetical protein [Brachybacterium sp. ACRRE]|uniref:hypothetical protein n=1 Tax=Brachybacterium sp. ACRRE TaxID=2918184 RepID=UPI001EF2C649|nr:hypothetical protein [Brachybacterium sp. ACRRE]MCG7308010.1 hypothetical protein [Brachybacterium sp. ACRRE]